MAILRATATINMASGVDADAAVNVWHFSHNDVSTVIAGEIVADALIAFYRNNANFLSPRVMRAVDAHSITVASLSPGAPGPDDDTLSKVLFTKRSGLAFAAPAGTAAMPPEVAVCLSFRGDIEGLPEETGSTRPASRKRGRIFFGPLYQGCFETTGEPLLTNTVITQLAESYKNTMLFAATEAGDIHNIRHVVYSPTTGASSVVVSAWVDNAPDIIRRRGVLPTDRHQIDIEQPVD